MNINPNPEISTLNPECQTLNPDLNVAHAEPDVTHPSWFADQDMTGGWGASPDDIGQPGYSINERKRFTEIRRRSLNPVASHAPVFAEQGNLRDGGNCMDRWFDGRIAWILYVRDPLHCVDCDLVVPPQ